MMAFMAKPRLGKEKTFFFLLSLPCWPLNRICTSLFDDRGPTLLLPASSQEAASASTMIEKYEGDKTVLSSSGLSSQADNQFLKTFEKKRFHLDLRTIRESPETVYI